MFKNMLNTIHEKMDTKKEENNFYREILLKTTTFKNLFPIPPLSTNFNEYKVNYIQNNCPDINKDKATLITQLIPIEETILSAFYAKEVLTNIEYYLIPTNKYLWVINEKNFGSFPYQNTNCQIIKNNLMSKIILWNNILLEVNGNDTKISTLLNILQNPEKRNKLIQEKTQYLCNITPIFQQINKLGSGISIDNQKNIVFHTKDQNYKYHINEIQNYEILLDNQVIFSTNSSTSGKISTFQNNCYQISMKIIITNSNSLIIPILEPNTFGSKYQRNDTIFQTNLTFAKNLIQKIEEFKNTPN